MGCHLVPASAGGISRTATPPLVTTTTQVWRERSRQAPGVYSKRVMPSRLICYSHPSLPSECQADSGGDPLKPLCCLHGSEAFQPHMPSEQASVISCNTQPCVSNDCQQLRPVPADFGADVQSTSPKGVGTPQKWDSRLPSARHWQRDSNCIHGNA